MNQNNRTSLVDFNNVQVRFNRHLTSFSPGRIIENHQCEMRGTFSRKCVKINVSTKTRSKDIFHRGSFIKVVIMENEGGGSFRAFSLVVLNCVRAVSSVKTRSSC